MKTLLFCAFALLAVVLAAALCAQTIISGLNWTTVPAQSTITSGPSSETSYSPAPGMLIQTTDTTLTNVTVQRVVQRQFVTIKTVNVETSASTVFIPVPTPETGF